ncbi:hypothetical protein [Bradyrhizobium sp. dw_78]|uniref:hypothetical protein n=1 Tax=Bradyrhizobium sp. dw_78 TaxID=2719793 RepID=UPI001BD5CF7C|nr:hypothetical protein [Bradyrhizobium sp. dw_78]
MTRAMTMIALTCLLVMGAAATSILFRNSVPAAGPQAAMAIAEKVVPNREAKNDRLTVASFALASLEPAPSPADTAAPLRQAFASSSAVDIEVPHVTASPAAPSKPKLADRPAPPKSYSLLSDEQIAGIKERLKLSPDQESYWPSVEDALRAVARKIHANRQADPHAAAAMIDPDSPEVQQLKSAAMPLLFQLREDQKREVRSLARLIGLEKVAAMI